MKICSVDGCTTKVMCKGWCSKHYYRLRDAPRCTVGGCDRPMTTRGMCNSHAARATRHGDPLAGRTTTKGDGARWIAEHMGHGGDECLVWPYGKTGSGYGASWKDGKVVLAHRMMCEAVHGAPPTPDHQAAHSCGKGHEGCVNPRHLRWATRRENHADALLHGTHSGLSYKGDTHHMAKLRSDDVRSIRRRLSRGETASALAREHCVSPSTITAVKLGKNWGHVR